jgi:hypothetical protein
MPARLNCFKPMDKEKLRMGLGVHRRNTMYGSEQNSGLLPGIHHEILYIYRYGHFVAVGLQN